MLHHGRPRIAHQGSLDRLLSIHSIITTIVHSIVVGEVSIVHVVVHGRRVGTVHGVICHAKQAGLRSLDLLRRIATDEARACIDGMLLRVGSIVSATRAQ